MFRVFNQINATHSSVGSERLFGQLHSFNFGDAAKREPLIDFFTQHPQERLKIQTDFAHLGRVDHNQSQNYLLHTTESNLQGIAKYVVMAAIPLVSLITLGVSWLLRATPVIVAFPFAGIILLISALFNIIYYQKQKTVLEAEMISMSYLVRTIVTSKKLAKVATPSQAQIKKNLGPLAAITQFAFAFRTTDASDMGFLMDYLNGLFMLPFIAYNFVLKRLQNQHAAALDLWTTVGDLEAAIAIANYRLAAGNTCIPVFRKGSVTAEGLIHPLLPNAVDNPVNWRRNTIITGSNASGKSTYVKSVAVNCILAQTINTCTAKSFTLQAGHVITAMAVQDNLAEGDSYFVSEIKAIKRLLDLVATGQHCYGFVDEILKGTNTVERIAASASVVAWLNQFPSLVMIATHDNELTEMLADSCDNWHFQETVTKDHGVEFDYQLHQGPATSHNAIALLGTMDYPESLIHEANQLADEFEQTKSWPKVPVAQPE
ncbi:MAG: DNA mismatch repair protein MutS [Schleiferilactobacillus perolens]|jgi:hypothetical protein|uniref:Mismatch repair ATPase n=1 Tax=Schleiferilactobacillus perolens DSM 12744 TaxID=1423792 RepID=A0A0R1MLQ3_9LACO|nr:DNA mismatch repair protein MutS [Schleiferilactobacillus perolens]KRL08798.1 mismatch repair ATPase [Schleiferilactobacillus perolens DSM 12744]